MDKIKNFLKNWGGFIALCIVALAFFTCFILSEFKCESDLLRVLIGAVTMPLCTISTVGAIVSFSYPKEGDLVR